MQILNIDSIKIVQILASLFFSIVFFQSGIDKIIDRKGNLEFFKDHFKDTLLNKIFSPALSILAFLEITTAGVCLFGFTYSLIFADTTFIFYGLLLAGLVLLMLLFGQRVAKDYIGAADITVYFIVCIITIMSFKIKG
jgi:energy-converting hydrogenase Eha subunit E|tara:strand:- start:57 stop:470 length:414 start_codon:yes stop_codon:yes gene_type:complete